MKKKPIKKEWSTAKQRQKFQRKNFYLNSHVKQLIDKYHKTGKSQDFEMVLFCVDNLVVRLVRQLRRRYKFMEKVEINDIYHTAIVGLHDAVKKVNPNEDPNKIPAIISSYIIAAIKQAYRYLSKEHKNELVDIEDCGRLVKGLEVEFKVSPYVMFDLDEFLKRGIITRLEYNTIRQSIYGEMTTAELARKEGVKQCSISNRIKVAVLKMKRIVAIGDLNYKEPIYCSSKLRERRKPKC